MLIKIVSCIKVKKVARRKLKGLYNKPFFMTFQSENLFIKDSAFIFLFKKRGRIAATEKKCRC